MSIKVKTVKDDFYKMGKRFESLNGTSVDVGVLEGEHAWLASIHEYGCRIRVTEKMRAFLHSKGLHLKDSTTEIVIPERSFLRAGFDKHHKEVVKSALRMLPTVVHGEMSEAQFFQEFGDLFSGKIYDYAIALRNPPKHPFTFEQTGIDNPLVGNSERGMLDGISHKVNR